MGTVNCLCGILFSCGMSVGVEERQDDIFEQEGVTISWYSGGFKNSCSAS